ncbi:Lipase (class 2) [Candidatus Methanoperedens nitroreducens]|uniref:Lipase (Class 2) n=1 Tax=Candidatus Methanoperedens nitratireducens TaxID=1392998 RepID=A0A062V7X7_9EURY|nr:alpha/beta fold hydrolase [Candidatus Methanoperedens nitroreducens]KCZ73392.1 Lipase (class 2) [Candidatus Methanoperedens nitroreducens]MDJ1422654.1 alpha/beta fold hydrolase [Candidatus Methanoperedens sp.]
MNIFPRDFTHTLTGFGGDPNMNKEQHRKTIKKAPIILIHGNAAHVAHPTFGWDTMKRFLKEEGYQDCEIWAMDYLGENRSFPPEMPTPVRNHIDDVREFIDDVIDYLNVERIDIICHSLGGMMTCAYMRGYRSDGTFDNANHRLDNVGTAVFLATANNGLGRFSPGEFQTGGSFEVNSHIFNGVKDDSPRGTDDPKQMIIPEEAKTCQHESEESQGVKNPEQMFAEMAALEESWKVTTELDVGTLPPQNVYVAITATGDFVDKQNKDTGRLEGAHCNLRFNLGPNIMGHSQILMQRGVFDAFKGCLNKHPPGIPVSALQRIAVSPVSIRVTESAPIKVSEIGEISPKPLSVTVNVTPADMVVSYTTKRVTKEYQAGYIIENVAETCSGKLRNGEGLTLSKDGIWDVTFSGTGASDIKRMYGVSVIKPAVEIETPDRPKFTDSLEVKAKASSGKLYFSFDGMHFNEGNRVKISETNTVYFIAIDKGNASEIVYRFYEKEAV